MATCVAETEFEEIGISYSVTENYFVTPNQRCYVVKVHCNLRRLDKSKKSVTVMLWVVVRWGFLLRKCDIRTFFLSKF